MGVIFNIFPLILVPVAIYNIWAFGASLGENVTGVMVRQHLQDPWLSITMASREANLPVVWQITFGDIMILISMCLLFVELLKSTSTGTAAIFNHALSMLVFVFCLIEFLLFPQFATSVFFLIMVMALLDVLAGVVVTIVAARRDVEFGSGGHN